MKRTLGILLVCLSSLVPAFAQQPLDAASKEDVEQLLTLIGTRERIQQMWAVMAQQATNSAADRYQRRHPNATPLEIRNAAEATAQYIQTSIKALPIDEFMDAMVPIYQRHFTHADVVAVMEFYNSPTGQKYLKEVPAMMSETMQAVRPIIQKHEPEIEAAAEKAAEQMGKPGKPSNSDPEK